MLVPLVANAQAERDGARPAPGQGDNKRGQRRPFEEAWKAADKDHDGFLSQEEFDAMPRIQKLPEEQRQRIFKRLDKDGDGKLSREELAPLAQPRDGQGLPIPHLWELDVDKSGGISLEEFKASPMIKKLPVEKQLELFRRLDTNHDGVITPEDKPARPFKREGDTAVGPRVELRQLIRRLDQNGDGAVSFQEFRAFWLVRDLPEDQQKAVFDSLDRNHDQKLTPEDLPPTPPGGRGESNPSAGPPPASPLPVPPGQ